MMSKKFCVVALKMNIFYNLCFKRETLGGKNMSNTTSEKPRFSELTELGIKFYKEKLKPLLEPDHNGEFVAIEPYSGRYFLDKDSTQVALKALTEMPDKKFYFARIGYEYAHKIGGSWLKKKA